ncbi:hypothetical protein [Rahnella bonaserana]
MKNLIGACLITLCFVSSAKAEDLAPWKFPSNNVPMLAAKEGDSLPVLLGISNSKTWQASLFDLRDSNDTSSACSPTKEQGIIDAPAAKINGKYVQMVSVCLGATGIIQPKTEAGKAFFNKEVLSGDAIEVALGDGGVLHFPKSNVSEMKQKVAEINAAM